MSTITNDKHMVGVIGSEIYYKLYGKYHARTRPVGVKMSMAPKAVERRLLFTEATQLSRRVKYAIADTFPHRPRQEKPWHTFTRLNYRCFTVEDVESGTVNVDYARLRFSQGDLTPPGGVTVTYDEESHSLSFTLGSTGTDVPGCAATDVVKAVVLVAEEDYVVAIPLELGTRGEGGMVTEQMEEMWQRENLHVYVYAQSADGTDVSVSRHVEIG